MTHPPSPADLHALREFLETTTDIDAVSDEARHGSRYICLISRISCRRRKNRMAINDHANIPIPNGIVQTRRGRTSGLAAVAIDRTSLGAPATAEALAVFLLRCNSSRASAIRLHQRQK